MSHSAFAHTAGALEQPAPLGLVTVRVELAAAAVRRAGRLLVALPAGAPRLAEREAHLVVEGRLLALRGDRVALGGSRGVVVAPDAVNVLRAMAKGRRHGVAVVVAREQGVGRRASRPRGVVSAVGRRQSAVRAVRLDGARCKGHAIAGRSRKRRAVHVGAAVLDERAAAKLVPGGGAAGCDVRGAARCIVSEGDKREAGRGRRRSERGRGRG